MSRMLERRAALLSLLATLLVAPAARADLVDAAPQAGSAGTVTIHIWEEWSDFEPNWEASTPPGWACMVTQRPRPFTVTCVPPGEAQCTFLYVLATYTGDSIGNLNATTACQGDSVSCQATHIGQFTGYCEEHKATNVPAPVSCTADYIWIEPSIPDPPDEWSVLCIVTIDTPPPPDPVSRLRLA